MGEEKRDEWKPGLGSPNRSPGVPEATVLAIKLAGYPRGFGLTAPAAATFKADSLREPRPPKGTAELPKRGNGDNADSEN